MFGIQCDTAGFYLVGTPTEQFHIPFEEMISSTSGILGLLEYGLSWKVLKGILGRMRHRLWHRRDVSFGTRPVLWIDNSGPQFYEVHHGVDSILVSGPDLETSCIGRAIKLHWDLRVNHLGTWRTARLVVEALVVGMGRNRSVRGGSGNFALSTQAMLEGALRS